MYDEKVINYLDEAEAGTTSLNSVHAQKKYQKNIEQKVKDIV